MPKNRFDNKAQAKRNRNEPRSCKKPKPTRYVSYDSQQTQKLSFSHHERSWDADERRRLRRRKHGWK